MYFAVHNLDLCYGTVSKGYKTVESEYLGPHDFKVYVDKKTREITHGVEFDHDGHPDVHDGSDNSREHCDMIYLHSHNPNHIALMAMLTNHEDHKTDNVVEVICEKYNMVYQRHEHPSLDHTYSLREITIDKNGIVTYPWFKLDSSWQSLVNQGKSYRSQLASSINDKLLTGDDKKKHEYCIEIIEHVILNEISKNQPWKIAWPNPETVTLDNSCPIGLAGEYEPNPGRNFESTKSWGAVPHEPAYHIEGDDFVLDAICPTTPAEAAELQPWDELHDEHPTHSTMVALHSEAREMLHAAADENTHITNDHVLEHMKKLQAARADSNPEPQ